MLLCDDSYILNRESNEKLVGFSQICQLWEKPEGSGCGSEAQCLPLAEGRCGEAPGFPRFSCGSNMGAEGTLGHQGLKGRSSRSPTLHLRMEEFESQDLKDAKQNPLWLRGKAGRPPANPSISI